MEQSIWYVAQYLNEHDVWCDADEWVSEESAREGYADILTEAKTEDPDGTFRLIVRTVTVEVIS